MADLPDLPPKWSAPLTSRRAGAVPNAAGVRARLLLEWYEPYGTEESGQSFVAMMTVLARQRLAPHAMQSYVETNPPADEIEGLPLDAAPGLVFGLVTIGRTVMLTCPNCPTLMFKVDTLADANQCAAEHVCES